MKRLVILSLQNLVHRRDKELFPLYLMCTGETSRCCHLNVPTTMSRPHQLSFLSLLSDEDWHLNAITTGPTDDSLPVPHLRRQRFAGPNCVPFLLFMGFLLHHLWESHSVQKKEAVQHQQSGTSTASHYFPFTLPSICKSRIQNLKKKVLPLDQALTKHLTFLWCYCFRQNIPLSYPIFLILSLPLTYLCPFQSWANTRHYG